MDLWAGEIESAVFVGQYGHAGEDITSPLFQVVAFAAGFRSRNAALFGFTRDYSTAPGPVEVGAIRVT
jgi:hypothetical protein